MKTLELTVAQTETVVELCEAGKAGKARAWLVLETDCSDNEARNTVKEVMEAHGIQVSGGKNDMEAMVRVCRENYHRVGKDLKRPQLAKMMAEASGSTVSTANHMISAMAFAKEWHKQETE